MLKADLDQTSRPFLRLKKFWVFLIHFKVPKNGRQHDIKIEGVVHNEMVHSMTVR